MTRLILASLAFLAILSGCVDSSIRTFSYDPPQTPGGQQCVLECSKAQGYCGQGCGIDQRSCVRDIQVAGMQDYEAYITEKLSNHQPIVLRAHDFERTEICDIDKHDCESDCQEDYRMCYEDCGGNIEETTPCSFLCF